ncbi:hypothetical protein KFE25_014303 [Diacronema lutheri]|uniref:Uncharacterized protein n=1 Tax=Diacronema lutheri TaxID=2081491 RepID=A0A8J5X601_DIALT|nr:hypothetical protein KFE25_014303 [Diacronema lutheri]
MASPIIGRRPPTAEVTEMELVAPVGYQPGQLVYDQSFAVDADPARGVPSAVEVPSDWSQGSVSSAGKRRVLLARKIRPGETIALAASPERVASFPTLLDATTELESILLRSPDRRRAAGCSMGGVAATPTATGEASVGAATGPRRSPHGAILPHTLIGTVSEYVSIDPAHQVQPQQPQQPQQQLGLPQQQAAASFAALLKPTSPGSSIAPSLRSAGPRSARRAAGAAGVAQVTAGVRAGAGADGAARGAAGIETIGEATSAEELGIDPAKARLVKRHELALRAWRRSKRALAARVGRAESETVLSRADRWRHVIAEARLVDDHRSLTSWLGAAAWSHGLRGANETFFPVSDPLSGLYMAIRRAPPTSSLERAHPELARRLAVQRASVGRTRAQQHELRIAAGAASDEDDGGTNAGGAGGAARRRVGHAGPPHSATAPPQTAASACEAAVSYFEQSRLIAGSAVPVDMAESRPALQLAERRLLFDAVAGGDTTDAHVVATNVGTTALTYTWRPLPRRTDALAGALELGGVGDASDDGVPRFFAAEMSGALLPGQSRRLRLSFASPTAGAFSQTWAFDTVPPLPADAPPARVELRALCTQPDALRAQRAALRTRLDAAEVVSFVRDLVLARIVAPAAERGASRPARAPLARAPARTCEGEGRGGGRAAFEVANEDIGLRYEAAIVGALHAIAREAFGGSAAAEGQGACVDDDEIGAVDMDSAGTWNLSVEALEERICAQAALAPPGDAGADARARASRHLRKLNALVQQCALSRSAGTRRADQWAFTWRALGALGETVLHEADAAREGHGLPVVDLDVPARIDLSEAGAARELHAPVAAAATAATTPAAEATGGGDVSEGGGEGDITTDVLKGVAGGPTDGRRLAHDERQLRDQLFDTIADRRSQIATRRAEIDALPAARPTAVRRRLLALGLEVKQDTPQAQKEALLDALQTALQVEHELLLADTLLLYPKARPPQRGQRIRREGQLWQWDWQACTYVLDEASEPGVRARRPEPCVVACVRSLVEEMADSVGRVLHAHDTDRG